MTDQKKIREAKKMLADGRAIPKGVVRPEILESWQRCLAKGLPMVAADKSLLPFEEILVRIRKRRLLCDIAFPYMTFLYEHIKGSGFLLMITDEEGYILYAKGDKDIYEAAKKNGLTLGANRSEDRLGTNGIGTVIVTKKPLLIFGAEHYYELHDSWACSGAPIFLPSGDIGGVVCLSGMAENVSPHTVGLVAAAADAISRQIKLKDMYEQESRMTEKLNLIIETVPDAILLLDRDLNISTFNQRLCELLKTGQEDIVGMPVLDLFEKDSLTEPEIRNGFKDRTALLSSRFGSISVSLSMRKANPFEYVLQIIPVSVLHKQTNRIAGNSAWFSFRDIIGNSRQIQDALKMAEIAAGNSSTVLLQGESGTGKELFAQAIHNASDRKDGPFIAVNCGAIPHTLIESELFGYERGAFTGAKKEGAAGKFELADGGTIFLDEIEGMPFEMQVALLRVIQNREVQRIGASRPKPVNVRIITASNQNLEDLVASRHFRQDLYFRINVFNIKIPPLRERHGDIPILAEFFLKKYSSPISGQRPYVFSEETLSILTRYPWTGNIRQLENAIERSVYMTRDGVITPSCLPQEIVEYAMAFLPNGPVPEEGIAENELAGPAPFFMEENRPEETVRIRQSSPVLPVPRMSSANAASSLSLKDSELQKIKEALAYTRGNVRETAALLGISRRTLYRKIELYHLSADDYRPARQRTVRG